MGTKKTTEERFFLPLFGAPVKVGVRSQSECHSRNPTQHQT
jgi:hypothetical protein